MKPLTILETLNDPELLDKLGSRRDWLRGAGKAGAAAAVASVPLALAATARSAFAQGGIPQQVVDVLNFALTLEYLEAEFYIKGTDTKGLIPPSGKDTFSLVRIHEVAHVKFLKSVLGAQAVAKPAFDFTAGGKFDTFDNYQTFTALAQGFEDTGVRAYKGQLGNLINYPQYLVAGARIHSVEARHASEIRRLRGQKGWITFNNTNVAALAPVYAGEQNTIQLGIDTAQFQGAESATESFDEPLTKEEVLAIAGLFLA